ncbi:hypothetical protein H5410_065009 [Solanum commersonii]|uniref:Uncharacterized protein n=1 Tax=Solanum commersonii TaxID=4109 RepID=A0A9J5VXS5_SOLCO|nr:hypothetical protein H5410_065009 [Solanum commersonii]
MRCGYKVINKLLRQLVSTINTNLLEKNERIDERILQYIPTIITPDQNEIHSLKLIMDTLGEYEHTSGQLINRSKSHLWFQTLHHKILLILLRIVSKKVCGWQAMILNFGGRITLIKHAVQSTPIHTMAAISPPNTTIKYIEAIIADFF